MALSTEWKIEIEEPGFVVGSVRGLVVQVWDTAPPTADRFQSVKSVLERLTRGGERVFALTIVSERAPMPDAGARAVAASFPEHLRAYVGVHEGSGFRASMVRAVLSGMALLARARIPREITNDVGEGVRLLGKAGYREIPERELLDAVRALRAKTQ